MRRFATWTGAILAAAFLMTGMFAQTVFADTESGYLGEPEEVYWEDSNAGIARWIKVEGARRYEVALYRENDRQVLDSKQIVSGTSADFREYTEDGNLYYFRVRAVPTDAQKDLEAGDWRESDLAEAYNPEYLKGRWREYREGKKYQLEDRTYVTDKWAQIKGEWYYFNKDSYMTTGWQKVGETWYYMNSEGIMQTGWLTVDGSKYYLMPDGSMAIGWVQAQPGTWYYMGGDGKMLTDTVVDGYVLDASGRWIP